MSKRPPIRWSLNLAGKRGVASRRPIAYGDSVYLSQTYEKADFYESRLLRANLSSGTVSWEHTLPHLTGAPVVDRDGVVFWACWDGSVLALTEQGDLIWRSEATGATLRDPTLINGALVACEKDRHVQLLDQETGASLWHVDVRMSMGSVIRDYVAGPSTIALLVTHGSFETRGHALVGLQLDNGAVAWQQPLPEECFHIFGWRGAVHVPSAGRVRVYDLETGEFKELIEMPDGAGVAHRPLSQETRMTLSLNADGQHWIAAYETGSSGQWASLLWRVTVPEAVSATPEPFGDSIGLLSKKGLVMTVAHESGELRPWFVHGRADDSGGIICQDDRLLVAHGRLFRCYDLSE